MTGRPALTRLAVAAVLAALSQDAARAAWPTFRHDQSRSGVTDEKIGLPLREAWRWTSPVPLPAAWAGPAKWDAFSGNRGLQALRGFDTALFTTCSDGRVYFGSSIDNAVHCLDIATGAEKWVFFTDGAVRLPPEIHDGRAYFGSDDGCAYCVDAASGRMAWKYRGAEDDTQITSNGGMMSLQPCRTGVSVVDGRAVCGFSLVPWEKSFLCILDARSGRQLARRECSGTFQGAMVCAGGECFVLQGRREPVRIDPGTGRQKGSFSKAGGVFCVTSGDYVYLHPNNQKSSTDMLHVYSRRTGSRLVSLADTDGLIAVGRMRYMRQKGRLVALDHDAFIGPATKRVRLQAEAAREKKKKANANKARLQEIAQLVGECGRQVEAAYKWRVDSGNIYGYAAAAGVLFVGGDDRVAAIDPDSGRELWKAEVAGKAYGLTISDGRLLVSTDLGSIHAFAGR
ncbi:MAG: outer membrane protein assembly factor BamB family protein [Planctomycetota bacterium]|jgi:outer membrane protein assembly factor BamB